MIPNMYNEGGVYRLNEEKGKGKIYKIINKSTSKRVDKLFAEKTVEHSDVPTGTYYFYINGYPLSL